MSFRFSCMVLSYVCESTLLLLSLLLMLFVGWYYFFVHSTFLNDHCFYSANHKMCTGAIWMCIYIFFIVALPSAIPFNKINNRHRHRHSSRQITIQHSNTYTHMYIATACEQNIHIYIREQQHTAIYINTFGCAVERRV